MTVKDIYTEVDGDGPPVVFSHDGLSHSASYAAQVEAFAGSHTVVTWDRRGYGRSPRPTAPFSSAGDLAAIVHELPGPAALVGCSFGSLVTMQCALDHPELVTALVLVGPVVTGLPLSKHFATRGGRGVPGSDASDAEAIEYWTGTDPWFIAPTNTAARSALRDLLTASPQNLHPPVELDAVVQNTVLPRLGEVTVPTLVLVGEHDIADVHAHAGAIEAAIPGARRVVLSGSGHLPHLEIPAEFNSTVLDFLTAVP